MKWLFRRKDPIQLAQEDLLEAELDLYRARSLMEYHCFLVGYYEAKLARLRGQLREAQPTSLFSIPKGPVQ